MAKPSTRRPLGHRPGLGLATRLLVAQVLVLVASIATAALVALVVGPQLFVAHLEEAGLAPGSPELTHSEQAYRDASAVSLGVAFVVALLCAVAVTWWLTRRIRMPLSSLADAAHEVSRGHYDVRVTSFGAGTEFDALGGAFNLMADRLERTEDTRRRLLADLAHELRTPISTINLYCEGLRDGVTTWDADTERVMSEQTARLVRLANDLDEVSRAEEGRIGLEQAPSDLGDLVRRAVGAARPAFARHGVDLRLDLREVEDVVVSVDERRMGQVFDNLFTNALRHTPAGGSVTVSGSRSGGEVRIRVADTGDGIPAAQLPHVFERFYRGDGARASEGSGSGIGLTISRAIVDAHGGSLTAESAGAGTGATLTIVLPVLGLQTP